MDSCSGKKISMSSTFSARVISEINLHISLEVFLVPFVPCPCRTMHSLFLSCLLVNDLNKDFSIKNNSNNNKKKKHPC